MLVPVQITFRNTEPSEAVSADIISCRVVVEAPLPNQRKGGLYRVRIELGCPEGQVIVNREPDSRNQAHQDVYLAVRDAFRAAERQLEEYTHRRQGEVKAHATQARDLTDLLPREEER
jgi:ribosome-associated translation inhibitor RaiA